MSPLDMPLTTSVPVAPFIGDAALPAQVEVAVIGGGIIGVSTALELASRGVSVALCEKGMIAGEQSSRNWGWVRQMGRAEAEIPLAIRSIELWRGMAERIGAEVGYRRSGIMYMAFTRRDEATWTNWHAVGQRAGVETQLLSPAEVAARLPQLARAPRVALWSPSDGCAEPWLAVPAMAEAARRAGARILTGCAVRGVETAGGRVSGVVTERGRIDCAQVVICGGAWTRLFAGNMGIDFPALRVVGTVARVEGVSGLPDHPLGTEDFSFRRRRDGQYTLTLRNANIADILPDNFRLMAQFLPQLRLNWREFKLRFGRPFLDDLRIPRRWDLDGPTVFETERILDPKPSPAFLRQAMANASRVFPTFAKARMTAAWAGAIDVTPDAVPVIDRLEALDGAYVASGFSGHGFGIGPGAGELMADLITGQTPRIDPYPYRFSRFSGSAVD
ncbi:NAD(P)/FAD-dependent oxidoreductase [Paracoccus sanguinis]|uniref:NAD(P)/FAD-dependent oxidoreductase n=1 Tax=Paracoccus sanguinis TaxID=1545044 RepID=UPI001FD303CC|nr:FAD-binding oxidoreductase [Paracoccus sanguinis]